jgi:hypothetical protein
VDGSHGKKNGNHGKKNLDFSLKNVSTKYVFVFFGGKNFDGDTAKWWYNGICMDAVCFGDII